MLLAGCLGSRVIENTRTPGIAIDQFGAISVLGKRIDRDRLAKAIRKAGFKRDQEINILIPENVDRSLMASISGELRRKGFSRIVFVSDKKAYSELAK